MKAALALLALLVTGCAGGAEIAGAVTGSAATLVSANPAVGIGVGMGVRAGTVVAVNYVFRRRHRYAQDEVAAVIGRLEPGESLPWRIDYTIPVGNAHGTVRLVRSIDNVLAPCREAVFSVAEDEGAERWFVVTACRQDTGWKWASAEPAVGRWGSLQ